VVISQINFLKKEFFLKYISLKKKKTDIHHMVDDDLIVLGGFTRLNPKSDLLLTIKRGE
jgi:hypothetical protein